MKLTLVSDLHDAAMARVSVSGKITQKEMSPFDEPLVKLLGAGAYSRRVLLDLGQTEIVDSSGVGWLMTCHKRAREAGGKLVLHTIPPAVLNTLKLLQLDQVLALDASENEALRQDEGTSS